MNDDARCLLIDEQRSGPFTVQQLYRMAKRGEIDNRTFFWSERSKKWLPLPHLLCDMYPDDDKLNQMRDCGIKRVKVIGSGWNDECDSCRNVIDHTFQIDPAPELPPEGCNCTPWCRCIIIALAE